MGGSLKIENLYLNYEENRALKGISLNVQENEIVSIIGIVGSGKSSILNAVAGITPIHKGKILYNDEDLEKIDATERKKMGISIVADGRKMFAEQTVKENLVLAGYMHRNHAFVMEKINEYLEIFPSLKDKIEKPAGSLNSLDEKFLSFARALMSLPSMLLIDMPSSGIDDENCAKIFEKIVELNKREISILLTETRVRDALQIANRAYVLHSGSIVLTGTGSEVLNNEKVKKAYLGE